MRIPAPLSKLQRYMRWMVAGAAGLGSLATSTIAWAQTCPLCYRAAAASRVGALQALRSGVLILMIPPVVIFGLVTLLAVRGRDRFNETEEATPADSEREPESLETLEEEDHA